MLAFAQACEVFGFHGPGELPLVCKLALPFAVALMVTTPVVLFLRGKLTLVICSRLAVVSAVVGHKSVELAPEVYDRATQSEIRDALGLVGKQLLPNVLPSGLPN